jgi:hypothetical protein
LQAFDQQGITTYVHRVGVFMEVGCAVFSTLVKKRAGHPSFPQKWLYKEFFFIGVNDSTVYLL